MAANLSQLFVGLFNAATGGYANQFTTSQANDLANVVSIVAGQDLSSNTAFVNYTLTNLGVPATGPVRDAAFEAVSGLIATQGRGGAVLTAADYLVNVAAKDSQSVYYSVGKAFVAKVAAADAYTATHPATVSVAQLQAGAAGNGGLAFTAATDTITLTGTNNVVAATLDGVTSSKNTYGSTDLVVGGATDSVVVSANDDVTTTPTIKGVGSVSFNLNALTTPVASGTQFDVKADNIDKGTALSFDNKATVTAVDTLAITGDKGGAARTVSAAFSTITDDTTADVTFNIKAVGTAAAPASLTLSAAAGNVVVNADGNITYTAASATGLQQLTASGNATISADKAIAAIVTSTGNLTVSDLSAAKTVTLTSTEGKVVASTANMLAAATKVNVTAAKTAAVVAKAATDVVISSTGTSTTASSLTNDGVHTIKSVTVSGNGGAQYLDLAAAGSGLASVTFAGSQAVTVKLDPSKVPNLATLTKTTTGAVGIDLSGGTGNVDLSTLKVDTLNLVTDLAATTVATLTVANGQTITAQALQGVSGAVTIAGKAATDSVTLVLNDGLRDANKVDLTSVKLSKIGTLNLDVSQDATSSGGASTSTITSLVEDAGTDATNVNITAGANGVNLGTVTLTGGNTLAVTGSGKVTAATAANLTMGTLDASAVTGVVTLGTASAGAVNLSKVSTVKTGTAADSVWIGSDSSGGATFSLNVGAGDDAIKVTGALGTNNVVIDAGDGTKDTLTLSSGAHLSAATGKTITISNVEKLAYDTAATIDASLLDNATYALTDGTTATITVKPAATMTTLDLSKMTTSLTDADGVALTTFAVDASSNTAVTSITGASVAKNTITGSSTVAATYVGGAKVDAFTAKAGLGTFTGGAGKDTYDLSGATGASATKFVTITDFAVIDAAAATVDTLKFTASGTVGTNKGSLGVGTAALTGWTETNGVLSKSGATLADFVTAAQTNEAALTGAVVGSFYAAAIGQDLYILDIGATQAVTTDDVLVKLTGIAQLGIGVVANAGTKVAGYVNVVG